MEPGTLFTSESGVVDTGVYGCRGAPSVDGAEAPAGTPGAQRPAELHESEMHR